MRNVVLLTASNNRASTTRLPYALKKAGLGVWVICPKSGLIRYSNYIDGGRAYVDTLNIPSFAKMLDDVVVECAADAIIPCDEMALNILDEVRRAPSCATIAPTAWRLFDLWLVRDDQGLLRRSNAVETVRRLGIATPRQVTIDSTHSSLSAMAMLGGPIVVKADNTSGGVGVTVVSKPEEAIKVADLMNQRRLKAFANAPIVAQEFLPGASISISFVAFHGRILEAFSYKTVKRRPEPFGASSVIELFDHPDMMEAAHKIVNRLAYTGFGGIDFILPENQGPPVFLEVNTRPTQTTHLGHLFGTDLCEALARALAGEPYVPRQRTVRQRTVALFPAEWNRDPNSPYLIDGYHDVPWQEQRLLPLMLGSASLSIAAS